MTSLQKESEWEPSEKQKAYWESMRGKRGSDTPRWKGQDASKSAFHKYLDKNYGQPKLCENKDCKGKGKWFDWCLKTGKKYSHNREDYFRMCRSCHRAYDMTPDLKRKAIINLAKHNPYGKPESYTRALAQGV